MKKSLKPEEKRARDIRNGVLLAHVVIEWVVILATKLKWWTLFSHGEEVARFLGSDEKAFQSGYIALAALVAFFFTSYDLVANADIQWPPLLASAFALGCAAEVTYKLVSERDVIYRNAVAIELARERSTEETAPVTSSGVASISSGVAAVSSRATTDEAGGMRLKIDYGLWLCLWGTFSMVLLSTYLTFFARRDGT